MGVASIGAAAGSIKPARLDPAVLMPGNVGQMFAAGLIVNQIEDECPHDRTPSFDRNAWYQDRVSGPFRVSRKAVSSAGKMVSIAAGGG
jgi:hypothetical protein